VRNRRARGATQGAHVSLLDLSVQHDRRHRRPAPPAQPLHGRPNGCARLDGGQVWPPSSLRQIHRLGSNPTTTWPRSPVASRGRGSPNLKVFRAEKDQRLDSFDHLTFYAGEEITVVAQHLPGVGSLGRCQGIIGWVRRLVLSVLAQTPAHQMRAHLYFPRWRTRLTTCTWAS